MRNLSFVKMSAICIIVDDTNVESVAVGIYSCSSDANVDCSVFDGRGISFARDSAARVVRSLRQELYDPAHWY